MSSSSKELSSSSTPKSSAKVQLNHDVSSRISFLWSASQAALLSNNFSLSNYFLDKMIKFAEKSELSLSTGTAICSKCANLMIPGLTAKVRLIPCYNLSDALNSEMNRFNQNDPTEASISEKRSTKKGKVKNCLLFKCFRCSSRIPVPGSSKDTIHVQKVLSKSQKEDVVKPQKPASNVSNSSVSQASISTLNTKAQKQQVSKEVAAKMQRKQELQEMLKGSISTLKSNTKNQTSIKTPTTTSTPSSSSKALTTLQKTNSPAAPTSGNAKKPTKLFSFLSSL